MDLISTTEAARLKDVSRQAIVDAMKRGVIDGQKVSDRTLVIVVNKRFNEWEPNRIRQSAGKSRTNSDRNPERR